jgi:ribonuclease HI
VAHSKAGRACSHLLRTIKPPKRKKSSNPASAELSVSDHAKTVTEAGPDTLICYTDGSASPNPGPTGAGAVAFAQNPDMHYDLGKSLGFSTNNAAEIYALGMLASKLPLFLDTHPLVNRVVVFCDSKLAIGACSSKKPPLSNAALIRSLRKLMDFVRTKIQIEFRWIKGHASVGGNERVDKISKAFANVTGNTDVVDFTGTFDCHIFSAPWAFGFPLTGLPLQFFTSKIPVAPVCAPFAVLPTGHSAPVSSVPRAGRAGPRTPRARVFTEPPRRSARLPVPRTLGHFVVAVSEPIELDSKHCD